MFKLQKETVEVQGKKIEVFEMTGRQRKELPKLAEKKQDIESYCIKECVPELKDMTTNQILDLPSSVYTVLSDAVLKLSGLSEDANEEAEKNS